MINIYRIQTPPHVSAIETVAYKEARREIIEGQLFLLLRSAPNQCGKPAGLLAAGLLYHMSTGQSGYVLQLIQAAISIQAKRQGSTCAAPQSSDLSHMETKCWEVRRMHGNSAGTFTGCHTPTFTPFPKRLASLQGNQIISNQQVHGSCSTRFSCTSRSL